MVAKAKSAASKPATSAVPKASSAPAARVDKADKREGTNHRHGQKHGKARRLCAVKTQIEPRHNGDTGAAGSGDERQHLRQSDNQRVARRYCLRRHPHLL